MPRSFVSERSAMRSEEHTSELQSRPQLVCRLLLENKDFAEGCEVGGEIGGALIDLAGLAREDAWHQRMRTDRMRVVDPMREERLVILGAKFVEERGILGEFRHAL